MFCLKYFFLILKININIIQLTEVHRNTKIIGSCRNNQQSQKPP